MPAAGARDSIVRRLIHDRGMSFSFLRYAAIGGFTAAIDFGSLQLLLAGRVQLVVATTVAFLIGICCHFTLNRLANFRDFRRTTFEQARTYVAIAALALGITLAIITQMTHHGYPAYQAKIVSLVVNLPLGFLCNRFMTFGMGIRATLLRGRRPR